MLAEFKAEAIHFVARRVIERLDKPDSLTFIKRTRVEPDFQESSRVLFWKYYFGEEDPLSRANIGLELAQQLINFAYFRRARDHLDAMRGDVLSDVFCIRPPERFFVEAGLESKYGWIADYELGYFESRARFEKSVRLIITGYGEDFQKYPDEVKKLFSTAQHFLGRASYGLAVLGVKKRENIPLAVKCFSEAQDIDRTIEDPNINAKLGFGYAWKTRCWMLENVKDEAVQNLECAREYFQRHLDEKPDDLGILAHMHLLDGSWRLMLGQTSDARRSFQEAVDIRVNKAIYPKGLADAYLGIARTYSWKNPILFTRYMFLALQAHPYTALRSTIGG